MRVVLYTDPESPRNFELAEALAGCGRGLAVETACDAGPLQPADLHMVVGVRSRRLTRLLEAAGLPFVFWDKGYTRKWPTWWRASAGGRQPLGHLERAECPQDRAEERGWLGRAWDRHRRRRGDKILLIGSTPDYQAYYDLPEPTAWAAQVVAEIRARTDRDIVYRPRPKLPGAEPVAGASYSRGVPIEQDLERAHCLVTHGSNACLDALFAGVPSVVLGDGVVKSVSSTSLDGVGRPREVGVGERVRLLANLAYTQWTFEEIRSGEAWEHIGRQVCG